MPQDCQSLPWPSFFDYPWLWLRHATLAFASIVSFISTVHPSIGLPKNLPYFWMSSCAIFSECLWCLWLAFWHDMTNSIQSLPFAEPLSSPQPKGQNHRSCAHLAHNSIPQSKRRSKHLKAKLLHLPHGDAPASRFEPLRHFLSLHVHADHAVAVCCFTCPWGFGFGCGWQFCPDSKSGFVGMNVMNVPCGFHRTSSKCVTLCFSMHTTIGNKCQSHHIYKCSSPSRT